MYAMYERGMNYDYDLVFDAANLMAVEETCPDEWYYEGITPDKVRDVKRYAASVMTRDWFLDCSLLTDEEFAAYWNTAVKNLLKEG